MKDDILEHLGKSIAITVGGFLFLYLMIVATQDHPIGIALIIVRTIETLAKWFFWAAILVASFFFTLSGTGYYLNRKRENKELERKNELDEEAKHRGIEREKQRLEEIKTLEEKQKFDAMNDLRMEQERRIAEEHKLKSRSAEDAVNEALKHFL